MKKDKEESQSKKMFDGVYCESSFFLFSKTNRFRRACYLMTTHKVWDNTVMALIGLSSFKLVVDTWFNNPKDSGTIIDILNIIDLFFNYCFLFEMLIK